MQPADAVHFVTEAMVLVMMLSLPPIAVASIVGVIVSLLQALTQVQEQTLSFAIKLIAVAVTLAGMAGSLGGEIYAFTLQFYDDFPNVVR